LTDSTVYSLAVSGTNIFAGTNTGGVFLSTNYGINWNPINSNLPTDIVIQSLAISESTIYAGTKLAGVWKRSLEDILEIQENLNYPFVTLYPNPSTGNISIFSSNLIIDKIEIINVFGEDIYSIKNYQQQKSKEIDLSNFPKGLYFVRIWDGVRSMTKKLVLK